LLFFIDESWQEIGGHEVGALGGVAIPEPEYNSFCREVFAIKRDELGARELSDCELKGNSCFARALSKPYKQLLFDMRALMRNDARNRRGALTFDQRHHSDDAASVPDYKWPTWWCTSVRISPTKASALN